MIRLEQESASDLEMVGDKLEIIIAQKTFFQDDVRQGSWFSLKDRFPAIW